MSASIIMSASVTIAKKENAKVRKSVRAIRIAKWGSTVKVPNARNRKILMQSVKQIKSARTIWRVAMVNA